GTITMQVTNFGARVVSLWTPDRDGKMADIVLGYENIDRYVNNTGERFLGAVVGRVANRIGAGKFTLDGKEYNTPLNNNGQTLHGGLKGVDMVVWDVEYVADNAITLHLLLPDGTDGFPGNLDITMTYTLTEENEFEVTYHAKTDKKTIVNLSHHSFFNLKGEAGGTITDHILSIKADAITPVDANLIPTGELMPVEGTPFDFREPHVIGERIEADHEQLKNGKGYDLNWVIAREDNGQVETVATLYEPTSGRCMDVATDQVAIQFYSGNFFDGTYNGKYGKPLKFRESVALETQKHPDAINHENFPSIILNPGEVYKQVCVYKFYTK
ncbi:MAG: galactose mutarotase, partial [Alistipes sp.]|nr:galactose mutarotase [Alistipes sp.]